MNEKDENIVFFFKNGKLLRFNKNKEKSSKSYNIKIFDNMDEVRALEDNKGSISYVLNDELRKTGTLKGKEYQGKKLSEHAKNLSNALNKLDSYKGEVYRSIDLTPEELEKYQVGKSIIEPSYTASSKDQLYDDTKNVQILIHSKNGKDLKNFSRPDENEVLFDKKTKFEVLNRVEENGKTYLELEEIEYQKGLENEANRLRQELSHFGNEITTQEEVEMYNDLAMQWEDIHYKLEREYYKPMTVESLTKAQEKRNSEISLDKEVLIQARQDVLANHDIFEALQKANFGTFVNANTPVDDVVEGKNKKVSFEDMYKQFNDTRKLLKEKYGDTITLYRAETRQMEKPTKNFGDSEDYVKIFGSNITKQDVPIEDILAINIDRNGFNEDIIVLQGKYKKSNQVYIPYNKE